MQRKESEKSNAELLLNENVLSKRGVSFTMVPSLVGPQFYKWNENKYDPDANPSGIVNLGTATNGIAFDIIKEKMTERGFFDTLTKQYFDYFGGLDQFTDALSAFLVKHAKSVKTIQRENVVIMNGLTTIIHCLSQVLCDEGDAILIPSPLYSGFVDDLSIRSNVSVCPVYLTSEKGENGKVFHLTVESLEKALLETVEKGLAVKALILTTPNNPLGYIYSKDELLSFMKFCARHKLHFVSDEIYLATVFGDGVEAVSSLSIEENPLDPQYYHVLYGISKDFAANGMRIGALISWSEKVLESMRVLSAFGQVSGLSIYAFTKILLDENWLEEVFFPTNRRRLLAAYRHTTKFLDSVENISYIPTGSGLYVWCDFRKLLNEPTFEAELKLSDELFEAGVFINPGQVCLCKEPGWFRLIFAQPDEYLDIAFDRMKTIFQLSRR